MLLPAAALVALAAAVVSGRGLHLVVPAAAAAGIASLPRVGVPGWRRLVVGLVAIVLYVPIRRYTVGTGLPFQLEPYRLYVIVLTLGWAASLLVDPAVRFRRTGLGVPVALVATAALLSDLVNPGRIGGQQLGSEVVKSLTFFLSFLVVLLLVASVLTRIDDVEAVLRALAAGGGALAVLGLVEAATGFDVFAHLHAIAPFLHKNPAPYLPEDIRGGRLRIIASAQHPIALSALFAILLPVAVYVARQQRTRLWTLNAFLLVLGVFATESRTGIVMLLVIGVVYLRLRPRETRRLWRWVLPAVVVIHLAVPGSLGALRASFFPVGGIVSQEEAGAGTHGSGRLADLGPSLAEWRLKPLFGEGYGTRIPDIGPKQNAAILDDQWLGTLLETGVVGVAAWLVLLGSAYRRLARAARSDTSERGWLYAGLAASVASFGVGMATYDAFSFIQVTLVFFLLLALGSAALRLAPQG